MTSAHDVTQPGSLTAKRRRSWGTALVWLTSVAALTVGIALYSLPGGAQQLPPTSPTLPCPDANPAFVMPPEIASGPDHILKGRINLTEEFQRLPTSLSGAVTCAPQLLRVFRAEGAPPSPPAPPANANYQDPMPGPTLRARVGDLVQLLFINEVNSNRFDRNMDIDACTQVGPGGATYPTGFKDVPPNCLHASTTANLHYHGTHTSPTSTGDNVFLQIRPLPRNNQGNLTVTPAEASVGLDTFFTDCANQLKNPLNQWPAVWGQLPTDYTNKQMQMLQAYQASNPSQPLWTLDDQAITAKPPAWPIYYIGAYPSCFALPRYTAATFPPPAGSGSPTMGQSPGTHWYHAHKHGSTTVNVMNGMVGAFIIEGEYDDAINAAYAGYVLAGGKPWNTKTQPVMVLNQMASAPNILAGGGPKPEFSVNGRIRPQVTMQPGEVQLWRLVNASARSAAYFQAPTGLAWRQLAQDGVQLADVNYRNNGNQPFYLAPGNRVDLLVQAPMSPPTNPMTASILIQTVMARAAVKPTPASPSSQDPNPGSVLVTVSVAGSPVTRNGQPSQMPFLYRAPAQPPFLTDITNWEWAKSIYATKKLRFDSKGPGSAMQHTINGQQFENGDAHVSVRLAAVEQWTIENFTDGSASSPTGPIDHPFHIHVNPFQITEVFDPNENLTDPRTGQLIGILQNGKTVAVPRFVISPAQPTHSGQCVLDPNNSATWKPCPSSGWPRGNLVWWDVFAIPSGLQVTKSDNTPVTIPGYFKMRSRFVDYAGDYVLHCHILAHEDRGMMFTVQVLKPGAPPPPHH